MFVSYLHEGKERIRERGREKEIHAHTVINSNHRECVIVRDRTSARVREGKIFIVVKKRRSRRRNVTISAAIEHDPSAIARLYTNVSLF